MWEKKKILVLIHSNPTRNRDFRKIAKKIQKTKKYHCGSFSSETGRDRVRMREKKNGSYQFLANPEYRIPKKIAKKFIKLKTSIWLLLKPKRDGTGWEWEKKKKSFQSIQTRPEIGNSKKNSKKIKKHYYDFFSCQNETREAEDERKINY